MQIFHCTLLRFEMFKISRCGLRLFEEKRTPLWFVLLWFLCLLWAAPAEMNFCIRVSRITLQPRPLRNQSSFFFTIHSVICLIRFPFLVLLFMSFFPDTLSFIIDFGLLKLSGRERVIIDFETDYRTHYVSDKLTLRKCTWSERCSDLVLMCRTWRKLFQAFCCQYDVIKT